MGSEHPPSTKLWAFMRSHVSLCSWAWAILLLTCFLEQVQQGWVVAASSKDDSLAVGASLVNLTGNPIWLFFQQEVNFTLLVYRSSWGQRAWFSPSNWILLYQLILFSPFHVGTTDKSLKNVLQELQSFFSVLNKYFFRVFSPLGAMDFDFVFKMSMWPFLNAVPRGGNGLSIHRSTGGATAVFLLFQSVFLHEIRNPRLVWTTGSRNNS